MNELNIFQGKIYFVMITMKHSSIVYLHDVRTCCHELSCIFVTVESESEPSDAETLLSSPDTDWEEEEEEEGEGDIAGNVGSDGSSRNSRREPASEDECFFHDDDDVDVNDIKNTVEQRKSPSPPTHGPRTSCRNIHNRTNKPTQHHDITYTVDSGCERWDISRHAIPIFDADTCLSDKTTEPNTNGYSQNKTPHPVNSLTRKRENKELVVKKPKQIKEIEKVSQQLKEDTNASHVTLLSEQATLASSPVQVRRCQLVTVPLPTRSVKDLLAIFSTAQPDDVSCKRVGQTDLNTTDVCQQTTQQTETTASQPRTSQLDDKAIPTREVALSVQDRDSTHRRAHGRKSEKVATSRDTQELHQEMIPKFVMSSQVNTSCTHAHFQHKCKFTNDNKCVLDINEADTVLVSSTSPSKVISGRKADSDLATSSDTTTSGCLSLGVRQNDTTTPSGSQPLGVRQNDTTTPSGSRPLGVRQNDTTTLSGCRSLSIKQNDTKRQSGCRPLGVRQNDSTMADNTSLRPADVKCKVWLSKNFSSWRKILHSTQSVPAKPVETPTPPNIAMSVQLRRPSTDTETDNMADDECSDTDSTICSGSHNRPLYHQRSVNGMNTDVVSRHVLRKTNEKQVECDINMSIDRKTLSTDKQCTPKGLDQDLTFRCGTGQDVTTVIKVAANRPKHTMLPTKKLASNHRPRVASSDIDSLPCYKTNPNMSSPLRQRPYDSYLTPSTVSDDIPSPRHRHCQLPQNCSNSTAARLSFSTNKGQVANVSEANVTPTRRTPSSRRQLDSDTCRTPQASDLFSTLRVSSPLKLSSSRPMSPGVNEFRAGRSTGAAESPSALFAKLKLLSPSISLGIDHTDSDPTNIKSDLGLAAVPDRQRSNVLNKPRQHSRGPPTLQPTDVLNGAQRQGSVNSAVSVCVTSSSDKLVLHCKAAKSSSQKIHYAASPTSAMRPLIKPNEHGDIALLERGLISFEESRPRVIPRSMHDELSVRRHTGLPKATGGLLRCSSGCVHDDCGWAEENRSRRKLGFVDAEGSYAPRRSLRQYVNETSNGDLARRTTKQTSTLDDRDQQKYFIKTRVRSADTTVTETDRSISESSTTAAKITPDDFDTEKIQRNRVCTTSSPIEEAAVASDSSLWSVSVIQAASVPAVSSSSSDNSEGGSEDTFSTLGGTPRAKQRLRSLVFSDKASTAKSDSGFDMHEHPDSDFATSVSTSSSRRKHDERLRPKHRGGLHAIEWMTEQSATAVESRQVRYGLHGKRDRILTGASEQKDMRQSRPRVVEVATRGRTCHLANTSTTNDQSVPLRNSLREATRHKRHRDDSDDDTWRRYHSPVKRANLCGSTPRTTHRQSGGSLSKLGYNKCRSNSVHKQNEGTTPNSAHKHGEVDMPTISCRGPGKCTKPFCFSCVSDSF